MKTPNRPKGRGISQQQREFSKFVLPTKIVDVNQTQSPQAVGYHKQMIKEEGQFKEDLIARINDDPDNYNLKALSRKEIVEESWKICNRNQAAHESYLETLKDRFAPFQDQKESVKNAGIVYVTTDVKHLKDLFSYPIAKYSYYQQHPLKYSFSTSVFR